MDFFSNIMKSSLEELSKDIPSRTHCRLNQITRKLLLGALSNTFISVL